MTIGYKPVKPRLTTEEIEIRVWAFVIFIITLILFGSCIAFIYSFTYVTQPMSVMAPIDKVYTKLMNDIVLLCIGVLGGVAGRKVTSAVVSAVAPKPEPTEEPPAP
jgi:hypothetical protein